MDRNDDAACTQCKGAGACRTCNGTAAIGDGPCKRCFEGMCSRCNGTGHDPDYWRTHRKNHGKTTAERY